MLLIWSVFAAAVTIVLIVWGWRNIKGEYGAAFFAFSFAFIGAMACVGLLTGGIQRLVNPDYYAIRILLDLVVR